MKKWGMTVWLLFSRLTLFPPLSSPSPTMRIVSLLPHVAFLADQATFDPANPVYTEYPKATKTLRLDTTTPELCPLNDLTELGGFPAVPAPIMTLNREDLKQVLEANGVVPGDAILVSMPTGQAIQAAWPVPELAGVAVVGPNTDLKMSVRDVPTKGSMVVFGWVTYVKG